MICNIKSCTHKLKSILNAFLQISRIAYNNCVGYNKKIIAQVQTIVYDCLFPESKNAYPGTQTMIASTNL